MLLPHKVPEACRRLIQPAFDPAVFPAIGASPDAMLGHVAPDAPNQSTATGITWYPLEVKCICPFSEPRNQPAPKIRRNGKFARNSSTPHERLPVHAAVQVQLQMLATDTTTCTLLSYTATRGMAVLSVDRDDAYHLQSMSMALGLLN
jgi:hypothetical protein